MTTREYIVFYKDDIVAVTVTLEAAKAVRRLYQDECSVVYAQTLNDDVWCDTYEYWPASYGKGVNE